MADPAGPLAAVDLEDAIQDLTLDEVDLIEAALGMSLAELDGDDVATGKQMRLAGYIIVRGRHPDKKFGDLYNLAGQLTLRQIIDELDDEADPVDPPGPATSGPVS